MRVKPSLLLLILMIFIGIMYGLTYHSFIMPFFGVQFIHCTIMGLLFGFLNFFVANFFYKQYSSLMHDNRNLNHGLRTDMLTEILSRRAFNDDIRQFSDYDVFSVIFLDIDNFRDFNNLHGHAVGDMVLKKVGYIIKLALGEEDRAYRYGGEEIVIILPEREKSDAVRIAEEIRSNVNKLDNKPYPTVTVSAGVASYPADGSTVEEVINAGDFALLEAKTKGKNRTISFSNSYIA